MDLIFHKQQAVLELHSNFQVETNEFITTETDGTAHLPVY